MISKNSLYRCPNCRKEADGRPGAEKSCSACGRMMVEVRKGIVTK